jgi:hypothetical protein
MIDQGKLQFRGEFGIASGSAVTDLVLLGVAIEFDNQVMRKMMSVSPNELAAKLSDVGDVLVCTKVDGEGTYVYFDSARSGAERIFAFSAGGRVRVGLKALGDLGQKLAAASVNKALLRCELCLPIDASKPMRDGVAEVIRVSFSGTQAELDLLRLVALDVVMLDGKDLRANQTDFMQTLSLLRKLVGTDTSQPSYCMGAEVAPEKSLRTVFDRLISEGQEGIVVRRLNRADIWKIKPHRTIDAVVIGYVEGEFEDKYGVNSLLTALSYPGSDANVAVLQSFVRVGGGLSDELRVNLLDKLRPLKVPEPVAMTDSSGRVIHFIRPEIVIEIHGEDFVASEQGKALRTQTVSWHGATSTYQFTGLNPCPRLTFARFAKFREDKRWQDGGARIEQLGGSPQAPAPAEQTGDSAAKLLRREVYSKGEMLRKLLVLHQPSAAFPYLIYWTDYSAKRAEPLKVSLEIAADGARADLLAARLLAENLPKGWAKL